MLNCVDALVGDESFIELRKQRRRHRTLARLERYDRAFEAERLDEEQEAEAEADEQLEAARQRMDEKIDADRVERGAGRPDQAGHAGASPRGRAAPAHVAEANIEDAKHRKIEDSFAAKQRQIRRIHGRVRLAAAVVPTLPALILGIVVAVVRSRRENRGASPNRLA